MCTRSFILSEHTMTFIQSPSNPDEQTQTSDSDTTADIPAAQMLDAAACMLAARGACHYGERCIRDVQCSCRAMLNKEKWSASLA